MENLSERGILQLCRDLVASGEELRQSLAERDAYNKQLDEWFAKIRQNGLDREARNADRA